MKRAPANRFAKDKGRRRETTQYVLQQRHRDGAFVFFT